MGRRWSPGFRCASIAEAAASASWRRTGASLPPSTKPQPDGTLVKALARAWRWQRMLDDGVYASVSEIGDAENISKSYVSCIFRWALLATDILEAILKRRADQGLVLQRLEQPLPALWEEQRGLLSAHTS
jgi:hypothetical protein